MDRYDRPSHRLQIRCVRRLGRFWRDSLRESWLRSAELAMGYFRASRQERSLRSSLDLEGEFVTTDVDEVSVGQAGTGTYWPLLDFHAVDRSQIRNHETSSGIDDYGMVSADIVVVSERCRCPAGDLSGWPPPVQRVVPSAGVTQSGPDRRTGGHGVSGRHCTLGSGLGDHLWCRAAPAAGFACAAESVWDPDRCPDPRPAPS